MDEGWAKRRSQEPGTRRDLLAWSRFYWKSIEKSLVEESKARPLNSNAGDGETVIRRGGIIALSSDRGKQMR